MVMSLHSFVFKVSIKIQLLTHWLYCTQIMFPVNIHFKKKITFSIKIMHIEKTRSQNGTWFMIIHFVSTR